MKKLLSMLLVTMMVFSLAACSNTTTNTEEQTNENNVNVEQNNNSQTDNAANSVDETPSTITVEHALGTTEVPYNPDRVCVLDSNVMDFIHVLDLGEHVASAQSPKGIPAYLDEYYNSDSIIVLERMESSSKNKGDSKSETSSEEKDPYEGYYTIDADLIIGSADTVDAELYEVLSQIAPTIVTNFAIDHEDGMYAGVKANARMIASIWGVESKIDELLAKYDAIYQELDEKLEGVSVVMVNSTMDSNRIQIVSNDDFSDSSEKIEAERSGRMLLDLGMIMYSNDAPEEVIEASKYDRNSDEAAQLAKNEEIADWIEQQNAEYVFLVDRNFDSIEEGIQEGYEITALTGLSAYKDGKLFSLSYEGKTGSSGLYGTFIQLDELKAIFLD